MREVIRQGTKPADNSMMIRNVNLFAREFSSLPGIFIILVAVLENCHYRNSMQFVFAPVRGNGNNTCFSVRYRYGFQLRQYAVSVTDPRNKTDTGGRIPSGAANSRAMNVPKSGGHSQLAPIGLS